MGGISMSVSTSTAQPWSIAPGGEAIGLNDQPASQTWLDPLPQIEAADDEGEEFDEDDFDDDFDDNFEDELEDDFEDEFEDVAEEDLDDGDFSPGDDDDEEGGPVEFEEDEDF
jgi:hypothetical protein